MKINDIFERSKQFLFIGQMELTQEELSEIKKEIHIQNITRNFSLGLSQAITLYIIHLAKSYSHDYHFYDYIEQSFDKEDFKFSQIYNHIEGFYTLSNRPLFVSSEGRRLFKSSILAQAMSPKDSMFGLFSLLNDILNESLLGYYQKGDPIIHTIAKKLSAKLSKDSFDEDDKELSIGSESYGLRASLKHSIISDQERFEKLIELIMCQLSNNMVLKDDDYLYKLLNQWQFQKSRENSNFVEKNEKKVKVIPINSWKPEISFNENKPVIIMPDMRLDDYETEDHINISVRFGAKMYWQELHTFGNELVMNVRNRKLELLFEENPSNTNLDLNIEIFQNKKTIFEYSKRAKDLFVYNNEIIDILALKNLDYVTIYSTFEEEYESLHHTKQLSKYVYFQDLTQVVNDNEPKKKKYDETIEKDYELIISNIVEELSFSDSNYKNIGVYNDPEFVGLRIPANADVETIKLELINQDQIKQLELSKYTDHQYFSKVSLQSNHPCIIRVQFYDVAQKSIKYRDGLVNFPTNHPFDNRVFYGKKHFVNFENQIWQLDPMRYQEEFNYLEGKVSYRFNYLTWNFGKYKAINHTYSETLWYELVNSNRLTITVKKEPIKNFSLRLRDIEITYSTGLEIDLITLFELFRSKYGDTRISPLILNYQNSDYELATFGFNPHLQKGFYFDYDQENLNIDFSRHYVGPEDKEFAIEFEKDNETIKFDIKKIYSLKLESLKEGYYKVRIKTKSESIFRNNSILLSTFNWIYGDPYKFRFENKSLRIDKCSWLENPNHFEIKGVELKNIKFISNHFFPQYLADLFINDEKHKVKVKIISEDRLEIEREDVKNLRLTKYRYDKKRKTLTNQKEDHRIVYEIEEMIYSEVENV